MMHADEQQPAAQSSHESSEGGQQGSGEGRRGRRRRGRGRRGGDGQPRPGHDASGADDASAHAGDQHDGNDRDDDNDAPASADGGGSEGGSEQERSKRKRRRKKKSGQGGADAAAAPAAPAGDGEQPAAGEGAPAEAQKQQQRPQQQQRNDRRRDGDKGGEKKERAPRGSVLQRRATRGDYDDTPKVKDEPAPVLAPVNAINVDGYIAHFKGWQREVLTTLRAIIRQGAGDIDESILWSQPVFASNGPVCYIKAFSDHVNFGFWRGIELDDPDGLLVGDLTMMRHITIRHVNDVKRDVFEAMVRQAVRLNRDKGDPTMS